MLRTTKAKYCYFNMLQIARIDAVLMVKDSIMIYRKKWNYFDLKKFETLFFASKYTILNISYS